MFQLGIKQRASKTSIETSDDVKIKSESEFYPLFCKLCRIVMKTGEIAFSSYIKNTISVYNHYFEWLQDPEIHLSLRRLKCQGMFTETQWIQLFPSDKSKHMNFPPYDLTLMLLIIRYTGIVSVPEPGGWLTEPEPSDSSTGALLVHYQLTRKKLASLKKINLESYQEIIALLKRYLSHFEKKDTIEQCINEIDGQEYSEEEMMLDYELFTSWHKREQQIESIERKIQKARMNSHNEIPILQTPAEIESKSTAISRASTYTRKSTDYSIRHDVEVKSLKWSDVKNGIPEEEKKILRKFYTRLLSEVRPDSMIDQLLSKKILNIEESGEVFSSLRSADQMRLLLNILVTKSGYAFSEFLGALKVRYYDLYLAMFDEYQQMKQEILANKPEGLTYCQNYLINLYMKRYNEWLPLLWYPNSTISLLQFYCPLQILDSKGNQIEPINLFSYSNSHSRVFVIEGDPGTGKTYLSHFLAAKWTNDPYVLNNDEINIQLVFHLDLKISSPNLKWMIFDQIFDSDIKLTEREIWEVLDKHQETCLYILDGYNDNLNDEVLQLISGTIFPKSSVIIFSDASSTHVLSSYCHEKYVLTGFKSGESINFTKNYIKLTKRPVFYFDSLLQQLSKNKDVSSKQSQMMMIEENINLTEEGTEISLNEDNSPIVDISELSDKSDMIIGTDDPLESMPDTISSLKFYSQFPLYCGFFCLMTDVRLSVEVASLSGMLENLFTGIKMKLIDRDKETRASVNKMFNGLIEVAFESVKQGLSTAFVRENDRLQKFGILKRVTSGKSSTAGGSVKYKFDNCVIQSFLAAKHLDLFIPEETNNYFQNLTINKSLFPLVILYCSLRKNDFDTAPLRTLYRKIIDWNLQIYLNDYGSNNNNKSEKSDLGRIMKFQLSLESVAAMNGRKDLAQKVGQTLPETILIEHTSTIPITVIQGISHVIGLSCPNIKKLDIRLNYLSRQNPDAYHHLAISIHKNSTIKVLRIFWEELDLMSSFFSTICETNRTVMDIQCIDESNHKYDNFNTKVAHNMRTGCRNMKYAESFAFVDCTFATLTHAIIRNVCDNLLSLDLSGCTFTIIACKDLGEKIIKTKNLRFLNLSRVKMQSMAFNTFIRSLSSNRTLIQLNLDSVKMDNVCFFSLAESLKLNNRLEKLSLLNVSISERNCEEISQVLKVNSTLKVIYLSSEKVVPIGLVEMQKNSKNTKIIT